PQAQPRDLPAPGPEGAHAEPPRRAPVRRAARLRRAGTLRAQAPHGALTRTTQANGPTMAKDLAIVLNNGSVNSAVTTALAAQRYRPILLYGEITPQAGSRARAAYDQQVAHFNPSREHSVPMSYLAGIGGGGAIGSGGSASSGAMSAAAADPRQHAAVGGQML